MKKVLKKRTGFTLVELLIVIIIIGILAGAMLLVAGSGTDKAEATKIVSDLRGMKAAMLMYYADRPSETVVPNIASLDKYIDREIDTTKYLTDDNADGWFVGRIALTAGSGITDKLKDVAKDVGLIKGNDTAVASGDYDGTTTGAWMKAR